jgi:hypothetical protein
VNKEADVSGLKATGGEKLLLLLLMACFSLPAFPQSTDLRGLKTVVSQLEGGTAVVGRQYAVLIGIDKYRNWMALRNPVRDAREIKEILSKRYFMTDFVELYDEAASKAGIIRLFNKLTDETKPEDSVLIFYAGHGHLDKVSNTGFWIPVDGGLDVYEQANWLPNGQIRGFISNMKARHITLIADSCFSGDFLNPTRGITPSITDDYFKNAYARISRQVLTSGASESVPDESAFVRQLKLALNGNTSPYLDPLMLYNQIRLGVKETTPLFGDLKDSGHQDGSSFLFFLKPKASQAVATKFSIEAAYGKASVKAEAAGTLYLDGVLQGQIPAGRVATIENIEFGNHELELRYANGEAARKSLTIDTEEAVSVTFSGAHAGPSAQVRPGAEEQATAQEESSSALLRVPSAAIKIDGEFDDWKSLPSAFSESQPSTSKANLNIDKVFLAMDAKNLYMKFDIKDKTPASFFVPNNFESNYQSSYGVLIENGPNQVTVQVAFLTGEGGRWIAVAYTKTGQNRASNKTGSSYAMRGSSFEAAFPLEMIREAIGPAAPGKPYRTSAFIQFGEYRAYTLSNGDRTKSRFVAF